MFATLEASLARILPWVEVADVFNLRCVCARVEARSLADVEVLEDATEERIRRSELVLRRRVGDGRLWTKTSFEMQRAARDLRKAALQDVVLLATPPIVVKPILTVLEVLLGPNAGPDVLKHWGFLRKALAGKFSELVAFLRQDALEVMVTYVATPSRLSRVREAKTILSDAGLSGATRDFVAKSSAFCATLWPVLVGITDLANEFSEADYDAMRIAADLLCLKKRRRQLHITAVVLRMPVDARAHIANGRILEALPLLATDLELFVVSRLDAGTDLVKNAILKRRFELRDAAILARVAAASTQSRHAPSAQTGEGGGTTPKDSAAAAAVYDSSTTNEEETTVHSTLSSLSSS